MLEPVFASGPQLLSDHFQVGSSPVVAALVLTTLDPAHRREVPCRPVLPFIGP